MWLWALCLMILLLCLLLQWCLTEKTQGSSLLQALTTCKHFSYQTFETNHSASLRLWDKLTPFFEITLIADQPHDPTFIRIIPFRRKLPLTSRSNLQLQASPHYLSLWASISTTMIWLWGMGHFFCELGWPPGRAGWDLLQRPAQAAPGGSGAQQPLRSPLWCQCSHLTLAASGLLFNYPEALSEDLD